MLLKRTAMGIGFLPNCINYLNVVLKCDFILFEHVSSTSYRDELQTLHSGNSTAVICFREDSLHSSRMRETLNE